MLAIAVCLCRAAAADPRADIDRAAAALDDLRYPEAVRLLDATWRGGGSSPAELRRIFALAGTAAASMGDGPAAQIWFTRWLCLEPSARLPAGSSPKLAVQLEAARRELAGRALAAHAARRVRGIAVIIDDDPLALVAAVRAGGPPQAIAADTVLPAASGAIALVDRYGNTLIELAVPAPASTAPVTTAQQASETGAADAPLAPVRPWYARWPVWSAAAGASAIGATIALYIASNADARLDALARNSAEHEYSEARAEEHTLARAQWTARIGYGVAIAAATVAIVTYIRGREVRTIVTPSGGGASVAWSIQY
ncbi:MAG TPA: hypothetical protein VLM79_18260 [Kofleriaceae bacterium]|nr:hypothetical protein [Kofleriaceae bacterium]